MIEAPELDCVVVGGGPGGASAANVAARAGCRVLILERERFPRFHIGESLLPASLACLDELGVTEALAEYPFVGKRGATFETACGGTRMRVDFAGAPGIDRSEVFHVPRAEFDQVLLNAARSVGVEVWEGALVRKVELESDGVRIQGERNGRLFEIRTPLVVDASGRAGVLARTVGLRRPDPALRKCALHAQFEDAAQLSGEAAGDIHVVVRPEGGWFWSIPLPSGRTSVGFVFDQGETARAAEETAEGALDRWISQTPAVRRDLAEATRIGPVRWDADFSYAAERPSGDRWALVGDAAAFLDPVFSTGVHLALTRGIEVGQAVVTAVRRGGSLRRHLRRADSRHVRRLRRYRRMVLGFYDPAFRDVFFFPVRWPAGARAVASVLGGVDRPSLATRTRIGVLFALAAVHRRYGLVSPLTPSDSPPIPPAQARVGSP